MIFDEKAKTTEGNHSNQPAQGQVQVQNVASSSTGIATAADSRVCWLDSSYLSVMAL